MNLDEPVPDELIPKTVPALAWLMVKTLAGAAAYVLVARPLLVWSQDRANAALARFGREVHARGSKRETITVKVECP